METSSILAVEFGIKITVFIVLILATILGNSAVIIYFILDKKVRTFNNIFLACLAVVGIINGCLVMPLTAIRDLQDDWVLGSTTCVVWRYNQAVFRTCTILHLCLICITWYLQVKYPKPTKSLTSSRACFMVIFLWAVSFLLNIPMTLIRTPHDGYSCKAMGNTVITASYAIVLFVLPLVIMLYIIIVLVSSNAKRAKVAPASLGGSGNTYNTVPHQNGHGNQTKTKHATSPIGSSQLNQMMRKYKSVSIPDASQPEVVVVVDKVESVYSQGEISQMRSSAESLKKSILAPQGLLPSTENVGKDVDLPLTRLGVGLVSEDSSQMKVKRWMSTTSSEQISLGRRESLKGTSRNALRNSQIIIEDSMQTMDGHLQVPGTLQMSRCVSLSTGNLQTSTASVQRIRESVSPSKNHKNLRGSFSSDLQYFSGLSASFHLDMNIEDLEDNDDVMDTNETGGFTNIAASLIILLRLKRLRKQFLEKKTKLLKKQATVVCCIITSIFVLCWTPYYVCSFIWGVCSTCEFYKGTESAMFWLGYCSSLVNPFLFTYLNDKFRNKLIRLKRKICPLGRCKSNKNKK